MKIGGKWHDSVVKVCCSSKETFLTFAVKDTVCLVNAKF